MADKYLFCKASVFETTFFFFYVGTASTGTGESFLEHSQEVVIVLWVSTQVRLNVLCILYL